MDWRGGVVLPTVTILVFLELVTPPRSQNTLGTFTTQLNSPTLSFPLSFVLETDFTRDFKGSSFHASAICLTLPSSHLFLLDDTWEVLLSVYPPSLWLQGLKLLPLPFHSISSPLSRAAL